MHHPFLPRTHNAVYVQTNTESTRNYNSNCGILSYDE